MRGFFNCKASQNIFLVLLFTICLFGSVSALDIYISPSGFDDSGDGSSLTPFFSINRAIAQANDNDVIIMTTGNYTFDTPQVVNKSCTIKGGSSIALETSLVSYSPLTLPTFIIQGDIDVVLRDFSFYIEASDSVAYTSFVNARSVSLENVDLRIVSADRPRIGITNVTTITIKSSFIGALVEIYQVQTLNIMDSTFNKTYSPELSTIVVGNSGSTTATARFINSTMLGRLALIGGVTPTIERVSFTNTGPKSFPGGCLYVQSASGAEIRIADSSFDQCTLSTRGGAVAVVDSSAALSISNTQFVSCSAYNSGGSLYAQNVTGGVLLNNTRFVFSKVEVISADATGSAVSITRSSLTILNSTFNACFFSDSSAGGAVAVTRDATFENVTFTGSFGGSARIHSDSDPNAVAPVVIFRGCTFENNGAGRNPCGGIHVARNGTVLTISNTLFSGNSFLVTNSSSSLLITAADVRANVSDSAFSSNYFFGNLYGGAVALFNPTSWLRITNSTFTSNTGAGGSACIYVTGGHVEILGQATAFTGSSATENGKDLHVTSELGKASVVLERGIPFSSAGLVGTQYSIRLAGQSSSPADFTVVPSPTGETLADFTVVAFQILDATINCTLVRCLFKTPLLVPRTSPAFLIGALGAEFGATVFSDQTVLFDGIGAELRSITFTDAVFVRDKSEIVFSGVNAVFGTNLRVTRAPDDDCIFTLSRGSKVGVLGELRLEYSAKFLIRSSQTTAGPLSLFRTSANVIIQNGYIALDRVAFLFDQNGFGATFNWLADGNGATDCLTTPAFDLLAPTEQAPAPSLSFAPEIDIHILSVAFPLQPPQESESVRFIKVATANMLDQVVFDATKASHPSQSSLEYTKSYENTTDAAYVIVTAGGLSGVNASTVCGQRPEGPFFYCEVNKLPLTWIGAGSRVFFDPGNGVYEFSSIIKSTGAPYEMPSGSSIMLKAGAHLTMSVDLASNDTSRCPILGTDASNPVTIGFVYDGSQLLNASLNQWTLALDGPVLDVPDVCYAGIKAAVSAGTLVFVPYNESLIALQQVVACADIFSAVPLGRTGDFVISCGKSVPVSPPLSSSSPSSSSPTGSNAVQSTASPAGAIVGAIVGVLVLVAIVALAVFFLKRRRRNQPHTKPLNDPFQETELDEKSNIVDNTPSALVTDAKRATVAGADATPSAIAPEIISIPGAIPLSDVSFMQELGKGSWGTVSLAVYKGEFVAVKRVSAGAPGTQLTTLMDEAKMMSTIKAHRNLVKFIGICSDSASFGLMMEFCPRGSLLDFMRGTKGDALSEYDTFKYAYGVLEGMIALTSVGLVHRDLAARNVLLDERMFTKVSDFGSSRRSNQIEEEKGNKQDDTLGPIKWQPPEVLNNQAYSEKSDVWSFGCTLLEIVTRREPYSGYSGNILQLIQDIKDSRTNPLTHLERMGGHNISSWPEWIVPTLRSCFEEDPSKRPSFREIRFRITPKIRKLVDQYEAELDEIDSVLSSQHYSALPASKPHSASSWNAAARPNSEVSPTSADSVVIAASIGDVTDLGSVERLGKLGEGSFGTVFLGKYKGQYVAIKVLNLNSADGQAVLREAEVMSLITSHRNIVQLFGIVKENDHIDIVMEFAPKGSCEDYVASAKGKKIGEALLFKWALGIARGMAHLTASKVIHRDLSARNVLLDSSLEPKIADFGLGRTVLDPNQESSTQTDVGPLRWFAPECFELKYSEKTDVWAYGCTLIELATGELPFPSRSVMDVFMAVKDQGATPMDEVPADLPAWLMKTMQKCFARNAKDRATFEELVSFIETQADTIDEIREAEAAIQRRRNKRAGTVLV
eukprot:TRINITY_DN3748_c0_g2_i2.p1 TRINITY_DN3748_c0_g2~~TRINITY_DN3748_c0_g2_i2.p1  ORF type:complete len:1820 (-),score=295.69 TRINITY_DN3748_c0_g2_i2:39-5498(-)